jgi:hypothetical protein
MVDEWPISLVWVSVCRGQGGFSWASEPARAHLAADPGASPPLPDVVPMVPAGVRDDPLMGAYPGMHLPAPGGEVCMDSAVFVVAVPPPAYSVRCLVTFSIHSLAMTELFVRLILSDRAHRVFYVFQFLFLALGFESCD